MRFYLTLAVLAVVFLFLQFRLWFESGGVRDMLHLRHELALQAEENDKVKKQNDDLMFQVQRMQNSAEATEGRARNELGMIKKDETFYQIVKKDTK